MPKMINKTFYRGPLKFGLNVLVGNRDHGRVNDVFVKNIHVSNFKVTQSNKPGNILNQSPILFGVETNEIPSRLPSFDHMYEGSFVDVTGKRAKTFPDAIYGESPQDSKWGYWQGSAVDRKIVHGYSGQGSLNDPRRFVIHPRDEEFQFDYDFSSEEDRQGWVQGDGTDPLTGSDYIRVQKSVGVKIDVSTKLAELVAANPSKRIRAVYVESSQSPETGNEVYDMRISLDRETDPITTHRTYLLIAGSGYNFTYASSSYLTAVSSSIVNSESTSTLDDEASMLTLNYTQGATYMRLYGLRICVIFQEMVEADPMFISGKVKISPNQTTLSRSTLSYDFQILLAAETYAATRLANPSNQSCLLPSGMKVQFTSDAGKTWGPWVDYYDRGALLKAVLALPKSCNLYFRWKFEAFNYTEAPSASSNMVYLYRSSKDNLSNYPEGVRYLKGRDQNLLYNRNYEYTSNSCMLIQTVMNLGDWNTYRSASGKNLAAIRDPNPTICFQIEPERATSDLQTFSYDVNIPVSPDEQFFIAFFAQMYSFKDPSTYYNTLCSPGVYLPFADLSSNMEESVVPYITVTGYEIQE